MILHLLRMRRNTNQNVYNDRENVSATAWPIRRSLGIRGRSAATLCDGVWVVWVFVELAVSDLSDRESPGGGASRETSEDHVA